MLHRPRFARPTRVTTLIVVTALSLSMTAVAVAGGAMSVPTFVPKWPTRSRTSTSCGRRSRTTTARQRHGRRRDCDKDLAPAADGNYAPRQSRSRRTAGTGCRRANSHNRRGMKAIVLDVDDTTLATCNYELCSNWAFDPVTNGQFVNGQLFPAVPGMVDMANKAAAEGYAMIFLTGRRPPRRRRRSAT